MTWEKGCRCNSGIPSIAIFQERKSDFERKAKFCPRQLMAREGYSRSGKKKLEGRTSKIGLLINSVVHGEDKIERGVLLFTGKHICQDLERGRRGKK